MFGTAIPVLAKAAACSLKANAGSVPQTRSGVAHQEHEVPLPRWATVPSPHQAMEGLSPDMVERRLDIDSTDLGNGNVVELLPIAGPLEPTPKR